MKGSTHHVHIPKLGVIIRKPRLFKPALGLKDILVNETGYFLCSHYILVKIEFRSRYLWAVRHARYSDYGTLRSRVRIPRWAWVCNTICYVPWWMSSELGVLS
jgi:hypothetical protein